MIEPGAVADGDIPLVSSPTRVRRRLAVPSSAALAFGGLIGRSTFLLFSVEPLIGRVVLPVFGGTPAVWATTLFFIQAVLLLGYPPPLVSGGGRPAAASPSVASAIDSRDPVLSSGRDHPRSGCGACLSGFD